MTENNKCLYCHFSRLKIAYPDRYHPFNKSYGPFTYKTCEDCGALLTSPMPTKESLAEFYSSSVDGMPKELREAREKFPQDFLYQNYVNLVSSVIDKDEFSLMDIGAGGGEFVYFFKKKYPRSKVHCVDFHPMPSKLNQNEITWFQKDLNETFDLDQKFDVITSFAVFEHMLDPAIFFENLKKHAHEKTKIVLVFPKYDSVLSKLLKDKWPYFIPGEHLTVPTKKSMKALIPRYFSNYEIKTTTMPYSLKYCLSFAKLNFINKLLPFDFNLPVPAGLFHIVINP